MVIQNLVEQALGQCELRELLGVGGMRAAHRAYHANLKRYVAVNVVSAQLAEGRITSHGISVRPKHPLLSNIHTMCRCMTTGATRMGPISRHSQTLTRTKCENKPCL
jgi:hypothetical protein